MREDPVHDNDKREALQPFSHGPRNYTGRNLAYEGMKLVITNLLWHSEIECCDQGNWLDQKIYCGLGEAAIEDEAQTRQSQLKLSAISC
ncbi:hypothetical protein BKA67DRAFT_564349 [Truncatella angustata]|uniref:Uncharacterized protein n=1 Tax=Truncatella angustata TaxID=152316 RepID=A0A9P8UL52_9PEZI|nr:uncharacterized protein BKA67DRAFT_564349 [Truncatella angustata]KAH6654176.1 hypothetical protein BKA67DRAFT_564349 [Truncatella angustata]